MSGEKAGPRADAVTKNFILTGKPGVGKTTLLKEAILRFRPRLGGFYTEQMLVSGKRMGFKLVTLDGQEAVLASKALASSARLNKYGVDVEALDRVGVRALRAAADSGKVVVVDEIGSMEAMSALFRQAVLDMLSGPRPVLATIREGAHAFTDSVKRFEATRLVTLRRDNFVEVKRMVVEWLGLQAGEGGAFPG